MNKNLHFNQFATPMTTKKFNNAYKIEAKDLEEYVIPMPTPVPKEEKRETKEPNVCDLSDSGKNTISLAEQNYKEKVVSEILVSKNQNCNGSSVTPQFRLPLNVVQQKQAPTSPQSEAMKNILSPVPNCFSPEPQLIIPSEYQKCIDLLETFSQRLGNDEHELEKVKGAIGRVSLHIGSVEKAIELQRIGNNDDLKEMTDRVTNCMQSVESRTKQYSDKRLTDEVQQLDYKIYVMNKKLQKDSCLTNLTGTLLGLVCIACLYQFFYMLFFKNMLKVDELQQFYTA